jgi:hypothetical protein
MSAKSHSHHPIKVITIYPPVTCSFTFTCRGHHVPGAVLLASKANVSGPSLLLLQHPRQQEVTLQSNFKFAICSRALGGIKWSNLQFFVYLNGVNILKSY